MSPLTVGTAATRQAVHTVVNAIATGHLFGKDTVPDAVRILLTRPLSMRTSLLTAALTRPLSSTHRAGLSWWLASARLAPRGLERSTGNDQTIGYPQHLTV